MSEDADRPPAPDRSPPADAVSSALRRLAEGDLTAHAELLPLLYDHLKRIAARQLGGGGGTLQATVLVHEAFLRLVAQERPTFESRAHFVAVAATAMRQIVVDHARRRGAAKRGGGQAHVTLSGVAADDRGRDVEILALHDALARLEELDPRQARLVELRAFGGLNHPEIAEVLGVSLRTVEKEWRRVKAWLARALAGHAPSGDAS